MSFQVTAILAAYNEEDIVGDVIAHLVAQGVLVYFIDHGSTDGTADEARRFDGRGLIGFEHLPAGASVRWADVLRRKEELARRLPGNWFIHHDADEYRESPWSDSTLLDAIRRVDALGYNAIDSEILQFRPTHDEFRKGDDPLSSFPFYEQCVGPDRIQIKCWKRNRFVSIADAGGHDVDFPGRSVFPIRFLLRHYPIRTQAQGRRKVLFERRQRFHADEHALGWHSQYEDVQDGYNFVRDPSELIRFDAEVVRTRLCIEHRGVEALRRDLTQARADVAALLADMSRLREEYLKLQSELSVALEAAQSEASQRADSERNIRALREALKQNEEISHARQERIEDLLGSWSWRGTAIARSLLKSLRGY